MRFCVNVFDIDVDGIDEVIAVDVDASPNILVDGCVDGVSSLSVDGSADVDTDAICRGILCAITRSTPGTMAAGTGGVAGSGDIGSLVGKSGGRTSGNLLYRFSFGDKIFISRNFKRNVSIHSCMISLQTEYYDIDELRCAGETQKSHVNNNYSPGWRMKSDGIAE